MSHTAAPPQQALYSFMRSHEQVLNVATSLASDIGVTADLMPSNFLLRQYNLLEMFLEKLNPHEKNHVLGAISHFGALQ